jgi:hypothetical protein
MAFAKRPFIDRAHARTASIFLCLSCVFHAFRHLPTKNIARAKVPQLALGPMNAETTRRAFPLREGLPRNRRAGMEIAEDA